MIDNRNPAPVDRVAARVLRGGENYTPDKKIQTADQKTPIPTKKTPANAPQLTGIRFGRMTVLGFAIVQTGKKGGSWVVRCDCGTYTLRRTRAIRNPNNDQDRCEECRHLAHLKRTEAHRRTGKDLSWRDF
ncbi:hypothetical protein [Vibrio harveyi]|uniref:hypothetical protein n=1 Tax=Vibrio harveyi TaxID=669 RepID=UPI0025AF0B2F|nr:hypothetical protein [Vibrio harveyi]WJT09232.1 hypothetical protein PH545_24715 [Vibrio harveyi]